MKILFVEDNADHAMALKRLLKPNNWEVLIAENSTDVMKIVEENQLNIILMDLQLEGESGYDVTRILHEKGYDIPILALSAYYSPIELSKCLAAGMKEFISKPIMRERLIHYIKKYAQ